MRWALRLLLVVTAAGCSRSGFDGEKAAVVCGVDNLVGACALYADVTNHDSIGGGTARAPHLLCSTEQWVDLAGAPQSWDRNYRLGADLDLSVLPRNSYAPIGTSSQPFSGSFDGCNHRISGLAYDNTNRDYFGLFGFINGTKAELRNVHLVDVDIDASRYVGGLVGVADWGSAIVNCSVSGQVRGHNDVGGLAGLAIGARIAACAADVTIEVRVSRGGGLIGSAQHCRLKDVFARADVTRPDGPNGNEHIGGLAGSTYYSTVDSCFASGSVSIQSAIDTRSGGLVGRAYQGDLNHCFATTRVQGTSNSTAGSALGQLVGMGGRLTNCWFDGDAICTNRAAGVDCNSLGNASPGGAGAAYFFDPSNQPLSNWDFGHIWQPLIGRYPRLSPTSMNLDLWGTCADHLDDAPFAGGWGSAVSPYLICSAAQLDSVGRLGQGDPVGYWQDVHYRLMDDIDMGALGAKPYIPIGSSAVPFDGVFSGNGYMISNLTISSSTQDAVGMFSHVGENGMLVDISLADVSVSGGNGVGALAGHIHNASVIGSHSSGVVTGGNDVGGLIGYANISTSGGGDVSNIRRSSSSATVSGIDNVGGLAGSSAALVTSCFARGDVTGSTAVGGLVGNGAVHDELNRPLADSYATGDVFGESGVGGLVGRSGNDDGDVVGCFSLGAVNATGAEVGRLIGQGTQSSSSLHDCSSACAGCDVTGATCVDLSATPSYFFGLSNPPMDGWSTNAWREHTGSYPVLR